MTGRVRFILGYLSVCLANCECYKRTLKKFLRKASERLLARPVLTGRSNLPETAKAISSHRHESPNKSTNLFVIVKKILSVARHDICAGLNRLKAYRHAIMGKVGRINHGIA